MKNQFRFHLLFNILRLLPKKYPVKYDGLKQPFFIIGSGRNGSTMLNLMLNRHHQLHLPSEQYFLGPSILKFHYYNYGLWRDMVKIIVGELIASGKSHTWADNELPDFHQLYLLPSHQKRLQYLLDVMYRNGASGELWGDTTPLNSYYLKEVFHTFPEATYFFLVRDGRDVISSYKKGGFDELGELADPVKGSKHWMHSVGKYNWLSQRANVQLIRYEELVTEPEKVLEGICAHLGVPYESEMLEFNEHVPKREMYDMAVHKNLKKPLFSSSIGSFQQKLTPEELDSCMPILSEGLKQFGYI